MIYWTFYPFFPFSHSTAHSFSSLIREFMFYSHSAPILLVDKQVVEWEENVQYNGRRMCSNMGVEWLINVGGECAVESE